MTKKPGPPADSASLDAIIATLHAGDPAEALAEARKVAGAMDQRPWEQLPPRLKGAIRADFRRLMGAGADADALRAAGYASRMVQAVRRDLGLGG